MLLLVGCGPDTEAPTSEIPEGWWKGNLHTHTLWSDGNDYPEMVIRWYKEAGYDFIALSDHNVLAQGTKWIDVVESSRGEAAFERYLATFGDQWVEHRMQEGRLEARLKTLAEYRTLFEEPGRFLIVKAEEITDRFGERPIHINATNLIDLIVPRGGVSVLDVMQNNVDAVLEQREATGQPMIPHVNHPNFGWGITAEDLIFLQGERFFEVYNGHPAVHNYGDETRPGTEEMWDIILSERLVRGREILYGMAVDDSHNYFVFDGERSNPGRAWVVVRAAELTSEALVLAMEAGDYYGSTGVILEDVQRDEERISLHIRAEEGVRYRTQFIGTPATYRPNDEPLVAADGAYVQRTYADELGQILAEVEGTTPTYAIQGNELYVRAKVISTKPKENPYRAGETEVAWIQPVRIASPTPTPTAETP